MRLFGAGEPSKETQGGPHDDQTPRSSPAKPPWDAGKDEEPVIAHQENVTTETIWTPPTPEAGGDTAEALFDNASPEPYTEDEERRLVRKIDFMIIPYLAVCYAFFYIDKTTLSYAAIFGIREDLNLVGTDYSWLSSMFYFVRGSPSFSSSVLRP